MKQLAQIKAWVKEHNEQNPHSGYIIIFALIVIVIALYFITKCFVVK
jgi:hypothetical protein